MSLHPGRDDPTDIRFEERRERIADEREALALRIEHERQEAAHDRDTLYRVALEAIELLQQCADGDCPDTSDLLHTIERLRIQVGLDAD